MLESRPGPQQSGYSKKNVDFFAQVGTYTAVTYLFKTLLQGSGISCVTVLKALLPYSGSKNTCLKSFKNKEKAVFPHFKQ